MTINYSKTGLKSGLEIHQQLDTGKLFSRTPSYLRKDKPDYIVRRKLHAVAGEGGEVDSAVKHEAGLDKEFFYEGYNDTISLVELDESPPQEIDSEALDIALQICLLLNCKIYQRTQIMRKTVIDGSNTSGFQRTVLIGYDGFVETSFGKVGIESVILEEDAARIIERDDKKAVFRLDRLGIPLVEIATEPVMTNPEQIRECALKIGEILRACKVKRGIGTIRQDVNISIKGHNRVEIKRFQDVRVMKKIVGEEIERQQKEVQEGRIIGEVRNALPDGTTKFLRPLPGKARMYPETDLPLLKITEQRLDKLRKNLPKMRHEIRDYLKKKGLNDEMIELVLEFGETEEFEILLKVYNKDANIIAKMVSLWRNEIASKLGKEFDEISDILNERVLENILEKVRDEKINEGDIKGIMIKIANGVDVEDALRVEKIDENALEEEIARIVKEKPGLRANAYMGLVISQFGDKVDKRKAMEIIGRLVK
jgi:Glu-tRNA(Gln) amidotransferase subunit E-like FAD-binding protein